MKKESLHRTIKLDADVANIASELASKRKLSKVISELLRREYGVSFEADLIQSQINELQRQRASIDSGLDELISIQNKKQEEMMKQNLVQDLEKEFSLLKINCENEIEEMRKLTIEDFNIETNGLEDHQVMLELAKIKGSKRLEIQSRYAQRREEIITQLGELKNA